MSVSSPVVLASSHAKVIIPRVNEMEWEVKLKPGQVPGGVSKLLSTGTGGAMSSDPNTTTNGSRMVAGPEPSDRSFA